MITGVLPVGVAEQIPEPADHGDQALRLVIERTANL